MRSIAAVPLFAALGTLLQAPVCAADVAPVHDGRAVAAPEIVEIIAAAKAGPRRTLQPGHVSQIIAILQADGRLDANEVDLVDELMIGQTRIVSVRPLSGDLQPQLTGVVFGDEMRLLRDLMDRHYASLLDGPEAAKGWEELVRHSAYSAQASERVRGFLDRRALAAAQESAINNVYQPVRTLISTWHGHNQLLTGDLQNRGGQLIFDSFEKADQALGNRLPDMLYNFTKPKAP